MHLLRFIENMINNKNKKLKNLFFLILTQTFQRYFHVCM